MAVLCSSESDNYVRHLECPVCLVTMRPPIYLCPTGHSICKECYESLDNCPQCKVSYGKIVGDPFEGERWMTFKCHQKCFESSETGGNRHRVFGNGYVNHIPCGSCGEQYELVSYKSNLITQAKFEEKVAAFNPQRNYSLEAMTACVLYPCESEECSVMFKLADEMVHKAQCAARTIECPCHCDCDWRGQVSDLYQHFVDRIANPIQTCDEYLLHHLAPKNEKFSIGLSDVDDDFQKVALLTDKATFPDYVFTFQLIKDSDEQLSFCLIQYGCLPSNRSIVGKVTIFSHEDQNYSRTFQFPVQNDLSAETDCRQEQLPSFEWLQQNHFMNSAESFMVEIDFWYSDISTNTKSNCSDFLAKQTEKTIPTMMQNLTIREDIEPAPATRGDDWWSSGAPRGNYWQPYGGRGYYRGPSPAARGSYGRPSGAGRGNDWWSSGAARGYNWGPSRAARGYYGGPSRGWRGSDF